MVQIKPHQNQKNSKHSISEALNSGVKIFSDHWIIPVCQIFSNHDQPYNSPLFCTIITIFDFTRERRTAPIHDRMNFVRLY